ncbi:hypothetical protein BDN71DRAFT_1432393 [Pleurotus eryngii]|uniref:Uncharacterized protein n=1 Tax=Pleurotus eryngii TaxID=5323 RepID=A0A9P5ZXP4_PLEER|nr:hypothetical protein BDN71DRAFT_1432393 [Pleurotus eryngii]
MSTAAGDLVLADTATENVQPVLLTSRLDERKPRLALLVRKRWPCGIRLTVDFVDQPPPHPTQHAPHSLPHECMGAAQRRLVHREPALATREDQLHEKGVLVLPQHQYQGDRCAPTHHELARIQCSDYRPGHTLGFPHEHLRCRLINWIDPAKAIDYYKQPPNNWTPE